MYTTKQLFDFWFQNTTAQKIMLHDRNCYKKRFHHSVLHVTLILGASISSTT